MLFFVCLIGFNIEKCQAMQVGSRNQNLVTTNTNNSQETGKLSQILVYNSKKIESNGCAMDIDVLSERNKYKN